MNYLGFDIDSPIAKQAIDALEKHSKTIGVRNNGAYRNDPKTTQVYIDTEWTEEELEVWLNKFSDRKAIRLRGYCHTGTFTRNNFTKEDGYLFEKLEAKPLSEF